MNQQDIRSQISRFTDLFTAILFSSIAASIAGLLLKIMALPAGGFVFILATSFLALLLTVQIGLSFFYAFSEIKLALIGAFCSFSLVLGLTAIIFRYQVWPAWQIVQLIALPVYLVASLLLAGYLLRAKDLSRTHRRFLVRNLLCPFIYTLVLFILAFALNSDKFYNTFKAREAQEQLEEEMESYEL